jgi:hypothetical protein
VPARWVAVAALLAGVVVGVGEAREVALTVAPTEEEEATAMKDEATLTLD